MKLIRTVEAADAVCHVGDVAYARAGVEHYVGSRIRGGVIIVQEAAPDGGCHRVVRYNLFYQRAFGYMFYLHFRKVLSEKVGQRAHESHRCVYANYFFHFLLILLNKV